MPTFILLIKTYVARIDTLIRQQTKCIQIVIDTFVYIIYIIVYYTYNCIQNTTKLIQIFKRVWGGNLLFLACKALIRYMMKAHPQL